MDAESSIKSPNLEATFRKHVKQYRALLRWGVDKVFQDTRVDILFTDAQRLIDSGESEKAEIVLDELKEHIASLESQYPSQKGEIEKELYSRIEQLERIIEKSHNIEQDYTYHFLQTLEIARVAMQNDDWAEAKVKINLVEDVVLNTAIIDDTPPFAEETVEQIVEAQKDETEEQSAPASELTDGIKVADETDQLTEESTEAEDEERSEQLVEDQQGDITEQDALASESIDNVSVSELTDSIKVPDETDQLVEKAAEVTAQELTTQEPIGKEVTTVKLEAVVEQEISEETGAEREAETIALETPLQQASMPELESLGPIAMSLYSTPKKSMMGKLVSEKDLQKTFHALDQSNLDNLRIGFIASPDAINSQLASFSKKAIHVKETGTQLLLLRLSLSRELTIYLVGIPANTSTAFSGLNNLIPELSACLVDTHNIKNDCTTLLINKLAESPPNRNKLFIKSLAIEEDVSFENIEFTAITNDETSFIEDAALHLTKYSNFE